MINTQKPLIPQGWLRAVLFLVLWLVISIVAELGASFLVDYTWPGTQAENGANIQTLLRFFIAAVANTLFVYAFRRLVDRKSFLSLGLPFKAFAKDAWTGFFSAPVLIGTGTLFLIVLNYRQFTGLNVDPAGLMTQLILMAIIAWSEELVVRGYLLNNLMQSLNRWIALGITAIFFASLHIGNPDVTVISLLNILLAGFLLGINYVYTRNLWFGILFHFSWNFFQGAVFGYEVSGIGFGGIFQQVATGPTLWTGGSFGFEGSLICLMLIIMALLFFRLYFSRQYAGNSSVAAENKIQ